MAEPMFRDLRADEIECRVAQAKQNGVSILLYKDARCDQNILDETVGPMNWQREHCRENANCVVSIWDKEKNLWIRKEDTGKESNTEAEKGLASDSFKRACFNWGIGRELYTAPFIWISAENCVALKQNGQRWQCFDQFFVEKIVIKNKRFPSRTSAQKSGASSGRTKIIRQTARKEGNHGKQTYFTGAAGGGPGAAADHERNERLLLPGGLV